MKKSSVLIMAVTSFILGFLLALGVVSPPELHWEATLPRKCTTGEKVLVTTPTPVEYYVCESVWKRR